MAAGFAATSVIGTTYAALSVVTAGWEDFTVGLFIAVIGLAGYVVAVEN